jgi:hypothetical protein
LGERINTATAETHPVVTDDESILVFSRKLPFYQGIFLSRKINGEWGIPVNIVYELGVDDDCFPTSISSDGTELYLYRSDNYVGDIFVSNYIHGRWTKIRRLNSNINTKYWESHACISHDRKTLYFTSNRKGGYGGLDIYKSTRLSTTNDDWGPPVNLGQVINSAYNEDTPFITPDDKFLYFSSFGHETMGGYDMFYSQFANDGTWSVPVNLGYPLNTTYDEQFFNPVVDGKAFYIAEAGAGGLGGYDIYRCEVFLDKHPGEN